MLYYITEKIGLFYIYFFFSFLSFFCSSSVFVAHFRSINFILYFSDSLSGEVSPHYIMHFFTQVIFQFVCLPFFVCLLVVSRTKFFTVYVNVRHKCPGNNTSTPPLLTSPSSSLSILIDPFNSISQP